MPTPQPHTRELLLVEDNPGDADLVREHLVDVGQPPYRLTHVTTLAKAIDRLRRQAIDVILLDLSLPDAKGVETVQRVREITDKVPIVVLTGTDDEELALSCIDTGAQDYLCKGQLRPIALRRAIGYAISRHHEAQLRELNQTLEDYRALSSNARGTNVTAALVGVGSVSTRHPEAFGQLVEGYKQLLSDYLDHLVTQVDKPKQQMEAIATALGEKAAGPRDLLDVHVAALKDVAGKERCGRAWSLAVEGRLVALEMMGLLVDYYRVGLRRRFPTEQKFPD